MPESVVRAAGAGVTVAYALFIGWLAASQPQTFAEVTGGLAASFGAYEADAVSFDEGLRFFRRDQFEAARSAWSRADPAGRDSRTQFYVAYSYYRQGWGRVSHDDALYSAGLETLQRAVAAAPGGRVVVSDPNLQLHTADELEAELRAGMTRDWSDLNPLRVFRGAQMTAAREAFGLPLTLLTVVLLGGIRLTAPVLIQPPTLFSLVLGSLLMAVFAQSGVVNAARLLNPGREAWANVNGLLALLALFLANAQVISRLTPEIGVPALVVSGLFFVTLLQMGAAGLDRLRCLRVCAVTLLSAFVIKFIVLATLAGPADRPVARALQALVDGLTFGSLSQPIESRAAGYLVFAMLATYLLGLVMLPASRTRAVATRTRDTTALT